MTSLKIKQLNSNSSVLNLSEQDQTSVVGGQSAQSESEKYWGYYASGEGDIIDVKGTKRLVSSETHKSSRPIVLLGNDWVDLSKW